MVSSGARFLRPVSIDQFSVSRYDRLDEVAGLERSGLVLLRVDAPQPAHQEPKLNPLAPQTEVKAAEVAKAAAAAKAGKAIEKLGLDYDRLWLFVVFQAQKKTRTLRHFTTAASPPLLAMQLRELARMVKDQRSSIPMPENFDNQAYLKNNPDVAIEVDAGGFGSGYEHYVLHGHLEGRERPALVK